MDTEDFFSGAARQNTELKDGAAGATYPQLLGAVNAITVGVYKRMNVAQSTAGERRLATAELQKIPGSYLFISSRTTELIAFTPVRRVASGTGANSLE